MQSVEPMPRSYCPGCMSRTNAQGVCGNANCLWHEAEQMESYDHLPRHFILMERYYIGRVLGQGGFGVTYMARDLKFDDLVAVKEFLPREQCSRMNDRVTVSSHGGDKTESFRAGIDGFLDEARTLRKLAGHPNILAVKDFDKANGTAYLVMEFLSGRTLKQYVQSQGGKIPAGVAVDIMLHVMAGLRKVHANGLLHRDVSPDNIMLTLEGPVKLLDFGSARYAAGEQSKSLSIILKAGYSPEEQYRTRGRQGPWTDVYAVAATLYRCITGEVPPPSLDRLSESEDELVRPSKLCPDLDPMLEAAILKGLAVKSADRYQSIDEFQQALIATQKAVKPQIEEGLNPLKSGHEAKSDETKSGEMKRDEVKREQTQTFWDTVLGHTAPRRVMAIVSLLAAIAYLFGCFHFYPAATHVFGVFLAFMPLRLAAGSLFFISSYLTASGIARKQALRWGAWTFLVGQTVAWAFPLTIHWWNSSYRTDLLAGFAFDLTATSFLVPLMFGMRSVALRRICSLVSGAAFLCLAAVSLGIAGPVYSLTELFREYFFYYGAIGSRGSTDLIVLSSASVVFLALSLFLGLPDEFEQWPAVQTIGSEGTSPKLN